MQHVNFTNQSCRTDEICAFLIRPTRKTNIIMKKLLLSVIFAIVAMGAFSRQGYAQEHDPWVGDWTSESYMDFDAENSPKDQDGSYADIVKTPYKKIFRITKDQDGYHVRGKTIKVKDPSWVSYHEAYTVTKMEGNTIWMQSFVSKWPFRVNGSIDSYSDNTYYYTLELKNGVIHYSYLYMHSIEYDRNMRYRGEETINIDRDGDELDLFNDNW